MTSILELKQICDTAKECTASEIPVMAKKIHDSILNLENVENDYTLQSIQLYGHRCKRFYELGIPVYWYFFKVVLEQLQSYVNYLAEK